MWQPLGYISTAKLAQMISRLAYTGVSSHTAKLYQSCFMSTLLRGGGVCVCVFSEAFSVVCALWFFVLQEDQLLCGSFPVTNERRTCLSFWARGEGDCEKASEDQQHLCDLVYIFTSKWAGDLKASRTQTLNHASLLAQLTQVESISKFRWDTVYG